MSLGSKEYICRRGIGSWDGCLDIMDETRKPLEQRSNDGVIKGTVRQIFSSVDGLEEEDIEPALVLAVSNTIVPVVWLNMTFEWNETHLSAVDTFAARFEFIEIRQFRSHHELQNWSFV